MTQELIEAKAYIIIAVFFLLFVLERLYPASKKGHRTTQSIFKNISFWPFNIALSLAIILPISFLASKNSLWVRPEALSGVAGLVLDIILLDFFMYAWHRALHQLPFLWRFHEVHHLDECLDTTSAIRFHFGELFFATGARLIFIILWAVPFSSVVIFEILVFVMTLFHHSHVSIPQKFENLLSKLIVTPSIHWVHHHAIQKDTDSNYSTIFSLWDGLFHTRSQTKRHANMKIGTQGLRDKSFVALLTNPFRKR